MRLDDIFCSQLSSLLLHKQQVAPGLSSSTCGNRTKNPKSWEREQLWKIPGADCMTSGQYIYKFEDDTIQRQNTDTNTKLGDYIRIFEDHDAIGHRVWDGATVFCKYMEKCYLERKGESNLAWDLDVRNKRILEVGCGTGIVGIIAALLGAHSACCTDLPDVTTNAQKHISASYASHVYARPLVWGDENMFSQIYKEFGMFDIMFGCDLAAPAACAPDLVQTLYQFLYNDSGSDHRDSEAFGTPKSLNCEKEAWILLQDHREFSSPFVHLCQTWQVQSHQTKLPAFDIQVVPTTMFWLEYCSQRHTLYRIRRASITTTENTTMESIST